MINVEMGDNKNPVNAATVVAVATSQGAPMDVAAFSNLASGTSIQYYLGFFFFSPLFCSTPAPPLPPPHPHRQHLTHSLFFPHIDFLILTFEIKNI